MIVIIGDMFQLATDDERPAPSYLVLDLSLDSITFRTFGKAGPVTRTLTMREFVDLRPYCSLMAYAAFQIEWGRVNGLKPEETLERLRRKIPAIFPPSSTVQ